MNAHHAFECPKSNYRAFQEHLEIRSIGHDVRTPVYRPRELDTNHTLLDLIANEEILNAGVFQLCRPRRVLDQMDSSFTVLLTHLPSSPRCSAPLKQVSILGTNLTWCGWQEKHTSHHMNKDCHDPGSQSQGTAPLHSMSHSPILNVDPFDNSLTWSHRALQNVLSPDWKPAYLSNIWQSYTYSGIGKM